MAALTLPQARASGRRAVINAQLITFYKFRGYTDLPGYLPDPSLSLFIIGGRNGEGSGNETSLRSSCLSEYLCSPIVVLPESARYLEGF